MGYLDTAMDQARLSGVPPLTHVIHCVQEALGVFETLDQDDAIEHCQATLRSLLRDLRTVYGAKDPVLVLVTAAAE